MWERDICQNPRSPSGLNFVWGLHARQIRELAELMLQMDFLEQCCGISKSGFQNGTFFTHYACFSEHLRCLYWLFICSLWIFVRSPSWRQSSLQRSLATSYVGHVQNLQDCWSDWNCSILKPSNSFQKVVKATIISPWAGSTVASFQMLHEMFTLRITILFDHYWLFF